MTVGDLENMFLRLAMASKENDSEFRFDTGVEGEEPLGITAVGVDDDGDVCLECDSRCPSCLSAADLAGQPERFESDKVVYFIYIDSDGSRILYNIKDGGTRDRFSPELKMLPVSELLALLRRFAPDSVPYFESGTINFTVNSVYMDEYGCMCLESNEIDELSNYTSGILADELSQIDADTGVYLYDDDSKDYYGICADRCRVDADGDPWINVR